MPYDAGMLAAICREINNNKGARCEKIYQTGREEIIICFRGAGVAERLRINAGANEPHMCFISEQQENPDTPPAFCMMCRKHLQGAVFSGAVQFGAERAAALMFDTRDEMGFSCKRTLIVEIMNKYSNIILTDGGSTENSRENDCNTGKILAVIRPVDFTTSRLRQVLPGMKYELPPPQNKNNILDVTEQVLYALARDNMDMPAEKFLMRNFTGFSPLLARELAYRAGGSVDAAVRDCNDKTLSSEFMALQSFIRGDGPSSPTVIYDERNRPLEYSFYDITEYSSTYKKVTFETASLATEEFYRERNRVDNVSQRAHDIVKLIQNNKRRIERKLALLQTELQHCDEGDKYKRTGDIITSNLHLLRRGMTSAELIDYYNEDCPAVSVELDGRLSPSDNAQHYYKLYGKCKTSRIMTAEQIKLAESELAYIDTVEDALSRASGDSDIAELRRELAESGYAKAVREQKQKKPKKQQMVFERYETSGGYTVYCGKNNLQNDMLTMKTAAPSDWWFHVKGAAGAHIILSCPGGEEPPERDFTDAAMIAAVNSSQSDGENIPVDYTQVKNVKKPAGSKPGYVIYKTNWTAYVKPDCEAVRAMKK